MYTRFDRFVLDQFVISGSTLVATDHPPGLRVDGTWRIEPHVEVAECIDKQDVHHDVLTRLSIHTEKVGATTLVQLRRSVKPCDIERRQGVVIGLVGIIGTWNANVAVQVTFGLGRWHLSRSPTQFVGIAESLGITDVCIKIAASALGTVTVLTAPADLFADIAATVGGAVVRTIGVHATLTAPPGDATPWAQSSLPAHSSNGGLSTTLRS